MRLVFKDVKEFERWIKDMATSEKHVVYRSEVNEILIVPKRSTRPVTYAYIKVVDANTIKNVVGSLESSGFKVYDVKSIEWADDRSVGLITEK